MAWPRTGKGHLIIQWLVLCPWCAAGYLHGLQDSLWMYLCGRALFEFGNRLYAFKQLAFAKSR